MTGPKPAFESGRGEGAMGGKGGWSEPQLERMGESRGQGSAVPARCTTSTRAPRVYGRTAQQALILLISHSSSSPFSPPHPPRQPSSRATLGGAWTSCTCFADLVVYTMPR
eukprot:9471758-Pyramimonas_sp.AAC.1